MVTIKDKLGEIKSIRQAIGKDYVKPDLAKLEKMQGDLQESTEAMDYLKVTRGLAEDSIEHFKLGYDKDREAIAIPVFKNEELINIKYRYLHPEKNKSGLRYTSERGAETWLYNEKGIENGKKKGGILVVEGEFDLMSAWQAGIKNVIAPASGKDSYGVWLELLDSIPKIYVAFDNDEGGKQTNKKFADRIGVEISFEVSYPDGIKDSNEFFSKHNRELSVSLIIKS